MLEINVAFETMLVRDRVEVLSGDDVVARVCVVGWMSGDLTGKVDDHKHKRNREVEESTKMQSISLPRERNMMKMDNMVHRQVKVPPCTTGGATGV